MGFGADSVAGKGVSHGRPVDMFGDRATCYAPGSICRKKGSARIRQNRTCASEQDKKIGIFPDPGCGSAWGPDADRHAKVLVEAPGVPLRVEPCLDRWGWGRCSRNSFCSVVLWNSSGEPIGGLVGRHLLQVGDESDLVAADLGVETKKQAFIRSDHECAVATCFALRTKAAKLVSCRFQFEAKFLNGVVDGYACFQP